MHTRFTWWRRRLLVEVLNRGVLGSVLVGLYGYGQPKLNISVCEILNRNQPKWLEIN